MRVYYDTEFIEDYDPEAPAGHQGRIDLISIGMVAEDGRELYAVSSEFDQAAAKRNPWLVENVWPSLPTYRHQPGVRCHCGPGHLDLDHPNVRPRAQIARMVADFIRATPDVELWAYYGAYDHVVMCWLFGRMADLPNGIPMFTNDLQQEIRRLTRLGADLSGRPEQADGHHNALADARHNHMLGEWLTHYEREALATRPH